MSIAELAKIQSDNNAIIAQKATQVYKAGQASVEDKDKVIEKTVSGIVCVLLDDVSEVPHKINVQLSSDTITDFSNVTINQINLNRIDSINLFNGKLELGTFKSSTGELADSNTRVRSVDYIAVSQGAYTLSTDNGKDSVIYIYDEQGNYLKDESYISWTSTNKFTFSIKGSRLIKFAIRKDTSNSDMTLDDVKFVKLEKHTQVTSNPDGKVEGLYSVSPNMTLTSDIENINITVTYHKSYGMQLEYDRFWDAFQANGTRTYYAYAFNGQKDMPPFWNEKNFCPKYNIVPISSTNAADGMFQFSQMTDLAALFEKSPGKLDFSQSTRIGGCFDRSTITKIPPMDLSSCTVLHQTFYSASAMTDIEINNLREDCTFNKVFYYASGLINLKITGTIGQNGLDFTQSTRLTIDSLNNIIACLKDYSEDTSGTTYTLTLGSTNLAKLSDEEKAVATQKGWTLA